MCTTILYNITSFKIVCKYNNNILRKHDNVHRRDITTLPGRPAGQLRRRGGGNVAGAHTFHNAKSYAACTHSHARNNTEYNNTLAHEHARGERN